MSNRHIVTSFDEELAQIESLMLEMGGLVETQIGAAVDALIAHDAEAGQMVRRRDKDVDQYEVRIDELATSVLARRQPMANDLRRVICSFKVTTNLERIGDYAKNIGKRVNVISEYERVGASSETIRRMSGLVQVMIRDVLDAFVARDAAMAEDIRQRDEQVDQLHNSLFRELLTYMMENPHTITSCMHLLFIAKNVERMGDHATSIAEQIIYLVDGALPDDERIKGDVTSTMNVET
ncbi:MAG: phosphate signaling complex protein PhoU [Pikeienuella sp.]